VLLTLTLATSLPLAAAGRKADANDPDLKALAAYRLEMSNVKKVGAAMKEFEALSEKDPSLAKTANVNAKTLDETVKKIEAEPRAMAVLKRNGLSARDYVMTTMTLMTAGMVAAFEKAGTKMNGLPPGVSQANVDFVKAHEKEIQALTPERKAKKNGDESADDDSGE
jgi:hypothetical protein